MELLWGDLIRAKLMRFESCSAGAFLEGGIALLGFRLSCWKTPSDLMIWIRPLALSASQSKDGFAFCCLKILHSPAVFRSGVMILTALSI